jgi:hypothetical protein
MPASGVTFRSVVADLSHICTAKYQEELEKLPFKKAVRDYLIDGFRDGFRSALIELQRMGVIEIAEDPTND